MAKKLVFVLKGGGAVNVALSFAFLFGGLWILEHVFVDLEDIVFFPVINEAIKDITHRCVDHLHKIPLENRKYSSARFISIIKRISLSTRSFMKVFFLQFPKAVLRFLLAACILFKYHFYGLFVLVLFACCFFVIYLGINKYVKIRKNAWKCSDRVTEEIYDSVSSTKTVRFYREFEMRRLNRSLTEEAKLWDKANVDFHLIGISVSLIFGVAFTSILMFVVSRKISVEDFILIKGILLSLFIPLKNMSSHLRLTAESVVDVEKIMDLLDLPTFSVKKDNFQDFVFQNLKARNLTFLYKNSPPVFKDLSFDFFMGEKILIQGKSGSGKSTFCKILSSLLSPQKGDIYLNDKNMKNFTREMLSKFLLFIPQKISVFNVSFLDNLTYGYNGFSKNEIDKAIEKAELGELVCRLKKGVHSSLGEGGELLSGGEIQKLALARAFLLKPSILILDESTRSLDKVSEKKILNRLFQEIPTIFLVSHHIEELDKFDRILDFSFSCVMEKAFV